MYDKQHNSRTVYERERCLGVAIALLYFDICGGIFCGVWQRTVVEQMKKEIYFKENDVRKVLDEMTKEIYYDATNNKTYPVGNISSFIFLKQLEMYGIIFNPAEADITCKDQLNNKIEIHPGNLHKDKPEAAIRFRPFTVEDMKDSSYRAAFDDPEVTRYNGHGLFPYTKARQEEFARELEASINKYVWAIELESPKTDLVVGYDRATSAPIFAETSPKYKMIGNFALQSINWQYRSAEFAIVVWDKSSWGQGIAGQALQHALSHAFNRLGLNRVWTGTAATNVGMQKVALKCGLRQEGTFREGMFLQGNFVNIFVYSILKGEYQNGLGTGN